MAFLKALLDPTPPTPLSTPALSVSPRSPKRTKFEQLLQQVESWKHRIELRTLQLDQVVQAYQSRLAPVQRLEQSWRRRYLLRLGEQWSAPRMLGTRQKALVREYLLHEFDLLHEDDGTPQEVEALDRLYDTLVAHANECDNKQPNEDPQTSEVPEPMEETDCADLLTPEALLRSGADPRFVESIDWTKIREAQSPHEMIHELVRQEQEFLRQRPSSPQAARREAKRAERTAAKEELRKRTVSTLYRQLAKVLHPDLEQDPGKKAEKAILMQRLTDAYRRADLPTLLQLESAHLREIAAHREATPPELEQAYCEILEEQVQRLRDEYARVPLQSRFVCIAMYLSPNSTQMPNWAKLAKESEAATYVLSVNLRDLHGEKSEIKQHLRAICHQQTQRQRDQRLFGRLFF